MENKVKKTGAIAILLTMFGVPSSGMVAKYAWDRIEKNTSDIHSIEKVQSADKVRFDYIQKDLKNINEKLDTIIRLNKRKGE